MLIPHSNIAQGLIGTPESLLLVFNEPDNYFYIEIEGVDKRKTEQPNAFVIDNRFVQVKAVNKNKFLTENYNNQSDLEIIKKYISWESDYLNQTFGFELNNHVETLETKKGNASVFWTYDLPTPKEENQADSTLTESVQKQMFILRLIKNCVVGIYTPLFDSIDYESNKNLFTDKY